MAQMTPERQCELARAARAHVLKAAALLGLRESRQGRERTRAGFIARVQAAAAAPELRPARCAPLAPCRPASGLVLRRLANGPAARAELAAAGRLWWALALSGQAVAVHEAQKIPGFEHADLLQEGLCGLFAAAQRFEPERGLRFGTMARWWARAQITRAIDQRERPVRLSSTATNTLQGYRRLTRERPGLTTAEAAEELGVRRGQLEAILASLSMASIEWSVPGTDDRLRLADTLEAPPVDLDAEIDDTIGLERIRVARQALPLRLREVLALGVDAEQDHKQVGRVLNLSRSRVQQLRREAEELLRQAVMAPGAGVPSAPMAAK